MTEVSATHTVAHRPFRLVHRAPRDGVRTGLPRHRIDEKVLRDARQHALGPVAQSQASAKGWAERGGGLIALSRLSRPHPPSQWRIHTQQSFYNPLEYST